MSADLEYVATLDASKIKQELSAIDSSIDKMAASADSKFQRMGKAASKSADNLDDIKKGFAELHAGADKLSDTVKAEEDLAATHAAQVKNFKDFAQAAVTAGGVIAAYSVKAIADARESIAAETQLAAAIKSTGGAAGQSLAALTAHANALQKISNFSDEDIEGAQGLLLQFKNIKQSFPEATQVMVDMAERMGKDLPAAAQQLGKILNIPTEAAAKLKKLGIELTEQQKEQIKAFVAAGDTYAAQKIILDELEKTYGGAALAARKAAGAQKDLEVSTGELSEAWGKLLLAIGDAGVTGAIVNVLDTLTTGASAWTTTVGQVKDLTASLNDLSLGFNLDFESFSQLAQGMAELNPFVILKDGVEGFYDKLKEGGDVFDAWRAGIENMVKGVGDLISGALASFTNIGEAINTPAPAPPPASSHPFANAHVPAGTSHGPGHFAGGGVIPAGQYGIVGERGPELASVTSRGAYILPNAALRMNTLAPGSSGGTVNNNNWSQQITLPDVAGLINNPVAVRQVENIVARALSKVF